MTIEELSSQIYKNTYNQLERSSGWAQLLPEE